MKDYTKTKLYIAKVNTIFEERGSDLNVEKDFQQSRIRKPKRFPDETSAGVTFSPKEKYRFEVFNVTIDTVIQCLKSRFLNHKELYMDFQCLHSSEFSNLREIPNSALEAICSKVKPFFPDINQHQLKQELENFACKWPELSKTLGNDCNKDEDCNFKNMACKTCKNCILCCYNVLYKYNLYAEAYSQLSRVYKYIFTLSISQVSCERSFSKLKFILNRLRNNLNQNNIEAFMLMALERDILVQIENYYRYNKIYLYARQAKTCQLYL